MITTKVVRKAEPKVDSFRQTKKGYVPTALRCTSTVTVGMHSLKNSADFLITSLILSPIPPTNCNHRQERALLKGNAPYRHDFAAVRPLSESVFTSVLLVKIMLRLERSAFAGHPESRLKRH